MSCNITLTSYSVEPCMNNMGGIKCVYLAEYQDNPVPETGITSGETISAFASGMTFYKIELKKNSGSLTSTLNVNENSSYVTSEVTIELTKMQKESRIMASTLMKGRFCAIVVDKNGTAFFLGEQEECTASSGTAETGTNRDDTNHYQVVIQDANEHWPRIVEQSVIDQLG